MHHTGSVDRYGYGTCRSPVRAPSAHYPSASPPNGVRRSCQRVRVGCVVSLRLSRSLRRQRAAISGSARRRRFVVATSCNLVDVTTVLLRLLFPSWAFFDRVTEVPLLQARVNAPDGTLGPWRDVLHAPPRTWRSVLYHPEGTAHLALQSVVDRFAVSCLQGEPDDISRDLVAAIAERQVRAWILPSDQPLGTWQWRIIAVPAGHADGHTDGDAARVLFDGGFPS